MNIFNSIKEQYSDITVRSTILDIRTMICDKLLMVFTILSVPAVISSLSRATVIGWKPIMTVHITLFVLLWIFFLRRKYISTQYKSVFILIVFLVVGFGGLIQFGLLSGAIVFLITSPLLAVLLIDERAGLFVLTVGLTGIGVIGALNISGHLSPNIDFDILNASVKSWMSLAFGTLLVSGALTAAMSVFNRHLINALEVSRTGEAELQKHKSELEDIVEEKTKELKKSNKALEQFAKIAAHDMASPLNAISGHAEILKMECVDKLDDDSYKSIDEIIGSVHYMSAIIQDQLSHSKFEKDDFLFNYIDMNTVLKKALHHLENDISDSSALVTHDTLPSVDAIETQIIRIFQNIISNAIKYRNKDKQLTIHVSVEDADEFWIFSISDNGIGIEPDEIENIFKIYNQINKTSEGEGIGLSSCKQIIGNHGGKIWVESELGAGSMFYFTLKRTS